MTNRGHIMFALQSMIITSFLFQIHMICEFDNIVVIVNIF